MGRNVQLQILRGAEGSLPSISLAQGEFYFANDTGNLFIGIPGFGLGYIQIGDMSQISDQLTQQGLTLEAIRRALVAIACEGGRNKPIDFDPVAIGTEAGLDSTQ